VHEVQVDVAGRSVLGSIVMLKALCICKFSTWLSTTGGNTHASDDLSSGRVKQTHIETKEEESTYLM
jgi:hypothetical protein